MGSSNETSYYGPVQQPVGSDARAGRLVGRLGGRGRRATRAGRHRHRHRRLDPPARGAVRHHRHQADVRPRVALRDDRVRVEPRSGRRARRARPTTAALLLEAIAGLDPRDSTSLDEPVPRYSAHLDEPLEGLTHRRARGVLRRGLDPDVAAPIRAALEEYENLGAKLMSVKLPTHAALGARRITSSRRPRLVEPVALRRRALRPSRENPRT